MRRLSTWLRLALPATAAAILLAASACGGGSDDGASPEAGGTPETIGALPLERFHYEASLTLVERGEGGDKVTVSTSGDYEAPDRHSFTYLTGFSDTTVRRSAVVIGDQIWMQESDGPWREVDLPEAAGLLTTAFSTIRPQFLGGDDFDLVRETVRRLPAVDEFVNDVPASHYTVDASSNELIESLLDGGELLRDVSDLRWELWLADDGGWPVRIVARGTVTHHVRVVDDLGLEPPTMWELRVDITQPNDPAVTVQAPASED